MTSQRSEDERFSADRALIELETTSRGQRRIRAAYTHLAGWPGQLPGRGQGLPDALRFSWVAQAEPGEITASYRHPNGEPLFDLGHDAPPPAR